MSSSSRTGCGRDAYLRLFGDRFFFFFFLSNWPNQTQLFLNFYAHEFPEQGTEDRLDVRLYRSAVWFEPRTHRGEPVRNFLFFSPTLAQVPLRLFFLLPRAVRDFFFFFPQLDLWRKAGSHVHVVVLTAPWHTFPFRQSTAAQTEQRGETDPLRKSGCHRCFWSLLERRCHSIPTASDIPLLWELREKTMKKKWKCVVFFFPLVRLKEFVLLWEQTLTAPPPR